MGIKIRVEDYDSLREALRVFRRETSAFRQRRRGRVRTDYYIKPGQLRRWRKGNDKIRAKRLQRLRGNYTPKKE
jgi:ribosomal protein S21